METTSDTFEITPEKMDFRAYSISWNLTKRCNLNCSHCYLDADFRGGFRTDELDTSQCKRVILSYLILSCLLLDLVLLFVLLGFKFYFKPPEAHKIPIEVPFYLEIDIEII